MTSNRSRAQSLQTSLFAIAAYPAKNNATILNDKSPICESVSLNTTSLPILPAASTSNEKGCVPYWNESCAAKSKQLWSPTKTGWRGSDLTCCNGWSSRTVEQSWFSTMFQVPQPTNLPKTCLPSLPSSLAECTDSGNTVKRLKKIRMYPTAEQRQILRQWMGTARFVYNQTVFYLQQPGTVANWKAIKTSILQRLPEWANPVPYQIKSLAVKDACQAVMNAKKKYQQTGERQTVKYRSRKAQRDSIFIPKSAVRKQSVYVTILGESLAPREAFPPVMYDCRLICQTGEYYLCVPYDKPRRLPENQRQKDVALDPGVRTFATWYSPAMSGKFGEHDFGRIVRLCYHLDALMSRISKANSRARYRMRKAAARLRRRIQNLVSELHKKVAAWLCKHFETIYLPTFETREMVTKLRSKTARAMLTWAHYRFKLTLRDMAGVYGSRVIDVNEAYTSKTCSVCGHIQQIGSREYWSCSQCGTEHDRDLNGARGIYLKSHALGDAPSHCNAVCV